MNYKNVAAAVDAAQRFINTAEALPTKSWTDKAPAYVQSSKESGAVRRASMDLTRALAEMRKP